MRVEAVNSLDKPASTIETHWKNADGESFVDLRQNPSAAGKLSVARDNAPISGFLTIVNGGGSLFSSVRAKTWAEEAKDAGADAAFCSRVDLVFAQNEFNFIRERYEDALRRLLEVWMKDFTSTDTLSVRLELIPCKFIIPGKSGIALRLQLTARGANAEQARMRWGLGIVRVQQALLFVSRAMRQKLGLERKDEPD
jgi:hypothetical protein